MVISWFNFITYEIWNYETNRTKKYAYSIFRLCRLCIMDNNNKNKLIIMKIQFNEIELMSVFALTIQMNRTCFFFCTCLWMVFTIRIVRMLNIERLPITPTENYILIYRRRFTTQHLRIIIIYYYWDFHIYRNSCLEVLHGNRIFQIIFCMFQFKQSPLIFATNVFQCN